MIFFKNSENLFDISFKTKNNKKEDNENEINAKLPNFIGTKKNNLENQNLLKTENNINPKKDFFPEYILQGLYLIDSQNNKESNNNSNRQKINNIWQDFQLSKPILNKYKEFWGMEHLNNKLELKPFESWEKALFSLHEKYGNKNSKNKNSLINEINNLLNLNNEMPEENNSENNNAHKKNKEPKLINNPNEIKRDSINQNQNTIKTLFIKYKKRN